MWNPRSPTNSKCSDADSNGIDKFESVQVDQNSDTVDTAPSIKSFAAAVEEGVQINDHYVDLENHDAYDVSSIKSLEECDDEKDAKEHDESNQIIALEAADSATPNPGDPEQDPVMVSQTMTLQTRNEELERERAQLQSETIQLRMENSCLKQSNDHIIAV